MHGLAVLHSSWRLEAPGEMQPCFTFLYLHPPELY